MTHRLTLQQITPVTHDTYQLIFDRPDGYRFDPGQATDLRLDRDGWRDEARPFTFTGYPDAPRLEFVIKSYPDHDGVTRQIGQMTLGDQVLIGDAWGAIEDRGPGTFIAGGAGITPFIAILRNRVRREGSLKSTTLIFANKRERDIILQREWDAMPGLSTIHVLEDDNVDGMNQGRIDAEFLDAHLSDFDGTFYLCGPPPMEDAVAEALAARGVTGDRLVREDG
jgi:ferredoxin-NADP reductase